MTDVFGDRNTGKTNTTPEALLAGRIKDLSPEDALLWKHVVKQGQLLIKIKKIFDAGRQNTKVGGLKLKRLTREMDELRANPVLNKKADILCDRLFGPLDEKE